MKEVYIALGSSLGNREYFLSESLMRIKENIGEVVAYSHIYETEPWGFNDPNYFLNQVIKLKTKLKPLEILNETQKIEKFLGRVKKSLQYEARYIDIDLLFVGNEIFKNKQLQIPHKLLHQRRFVLKPLAEIAPDLIHPLLQCSVKYLLNICEDNTSVKLINSCVHTNH